MEHFDLQAVVALVVFVGYAVLDSLADAFIFRWMNGGVKAAWQARLIKTTTAGAKTLFLPREAADYNTNWHRAQAAQQALVIGAISYLSGHWSLLLLGAGLFWLIHDGIVNRVGLDRPFFFVGTTAWIDRQFQKFKKPEMAMAVAKIGSILAGAALLFILK